MTTSSKARVLVIDDDDIIRMQVEHILNLYDYTPLTATNGKEGVTKASSEKPDLIILDRRMPEMDGNQTLSHLKADETTKNIPVIMLTGDGKSEDIQESIKLGASHYVVKPFEKEKLLQAIEKILHMQK